MAINKRAAEIQQEIDAVNKECDEAIAAVEATFQPRLDALHDELNAIQDDDIFERFGVRDGDHLRATHEFLDLIEAKRQRKSGFFRHWTADADYTVSQIYYGKLEASVNHEFDGGTGLIPLSVIAGMRKAYLEALQPK
jgi:hypothetical protein